ncbi:MAG: energy-coupling factor ABC transporter ATP-binding protein [Bacteroidaceae bacterium]|nr:energy-coupling factor ABC transporter ATP-binding protein [Bacteroidaceae bacterium]
MNALEIEEVSYTYDDERGKPTHQVLDYISFTVAENENVGLVGANGVGKSTLLKVICGLLPLQNGRVNIAGISMNKANLKSIRQQLGYVFQDSESQLFMSTVFEDVAFAPRNYGYSREAYERMTMDALRQVGLEDCRDKYIYKLSGGEKKLASIATVLAMQSKLMLLDEPTVGLDPRNRRRLLQVVNNLPCAKLIASHDLDFIYDTCQRVVLLSEKGIAAVGPAKEVLRNQTLLEKHGLELPLSFSR